MPSTDPYYPFRFLVFLKQPQWTVSWEFLGPEICVHTDSHAPDDRVVVPDQES